MRTRTVFCIVLHCRESPAGHRVARLLSPDGIIDAFVFGGGKAKLKSFVSPWHAGQVWLHDDRARGFIILNDFDPQMEFSGIRSALSSIMVASIASEFIIVSDALGGEGLKSTKLMLELLEALDSDSSLAEMVFIQFALRVAEIMGVLPETGTCACCSREISPSLVHHWDRYQAAFVCQQCIEGNATISLPSGAMSFLSKCLNMDFADAVKIRLSEASTGALKTLAVELLKFTAGTRLKCLDDSFFRDISFSQTRK